MFCVHLAAEELFVACDLSVDGKTIRISECFSYLCNLGIRDLFHSYIDARGSFSERPNTFLNPTISILI